VFSKAADPLLLGNVPPTGEWYVMCWLEFVTVIYERITVTSLSMSLAVSSTQPWQLMHDIFVGDAPCKAYAWYTCQQIWCAYCHG